jgi:hypothetical protein
MSAVFILWLRQLKLCFRSRARMIGSLGQPILSCWRSPSGSGPALPAPGTHGMPQE